MKKTKILGICSIFALLMTACNADTTNKKNDFTYVEPPSFVPGDFQLSEIDLNGDDTLKNKIAELKNTPEADRDYSIIFPILNNSFIKPSKVNLVKNDQLNIDADGDGEIFDEVGNYQIKQTYTAQRDNDNFKKSGSYTKSSKKSVGKDQITIKYDSIIVPSEPGTSSSSENSNPVLETVLEFNDEGICFKKTPDELTSFKNLIFTPNVSVEFPKDRVDKNGNKPSSDTYSTVFPEVLNNTTWTANNSSKETLSFTFNESGSGILNWKLGDTVLENFKYKESKSVIRYDDFYFDKVIEEAKTIDYEVYVDIENDVMNEKIITDGKEEVNTPKLTELLVYEKMTVASLFTYQNSITKYYNENKENLTLVGSIGDKLSVKLSFELSFSEHLVETIYEFDVSLEGMVTKAKLIDQKRSISKPENVYEMHNLEYTFE